MKSSLTARALLGFGGVMAAAAMFATNASAQVLSSGADAGATLEAGVRYRNFGGSGAGGAAEVIVFNSPCCAGTNGQGPWVGANNFSITLDLADLSTTAAGAATTRSVGDLGDLNYIQIQITKNGAANGVALNNIRLNGGASLGSISILGGANTLLWKITGASLSPPFGLSGTLVLTGMQPGADDNFVQIEVGHVAPPDAEGPITSSVVTDPVPALLNGLVTVTANVSDVTTGNNNVASAEYQIDGGLWQPMTAEDLAFDSPTEDVEASFTATTVGTHEVCVRGADSIGNIGDAACQTYLVTHKFTGFFEPIDNYALNTVKAGQAIPAKWRLTDALDMPISDPASFVSLSSYPISCTDFSGDPQDAIEEVASGASGLQYSGEGYWQFNWKTPKTYASTCRAMYVEFNSGATSPVVKFSFKR